MRSGTPRIGRFTARKGRSAGNKLIGANWRTERADAVFQGFMAEKKKFQAIKGTRDLLPPETELWNRVEQTAREVFGTFGFGEIRPPILEEYALFSRSVGEESDIVAKELLISWDAPVDLWDVARAKLSSSLELTHSLERNWHLFAAHTADAVVKNAESALLVQAKRLQDQSASAKELDQYLRDHLRMWIEGSNEWRNIRNYLAHVSQIDEWTKVVLRPEATASVCRAYIEHGMHALPQPVKLWYTGPMFRRGRPQRGG